MANERLPRLSADRVALRPLDRADAAALYAIFGDPRVTRYWSTPSWKGLDDAFSYLASIEKGARTGSLHQWGIERWEARGVIGTCTLASIDRDQGRAEIGFALAHGHQGRGLMREALHAILDHAFGSLGLRRIEADIDPRNTPSIRLVRRLGFRYEGLLRERWIVGDEVTDSAFYGLLRREWEAEARRC